MWRSLTKIFWNIEVWAVQKHVNLVDLVKSFPTNIFLQNLASIQKRTSPIKFARLAEKSENGSISNLSTKAGRRGRRGGGGGGRGRWRRLASDFKCPDRGKGKGNFEVPFSRFPELFRARSRLYRSQILQVNTRWKALVEIYTMHSFAPFWNRIPKSRKTMGRKEPGPTPGKMARRSS